MSRLWLPAFFLLSLLALSGCKPPPHLVAVRQVDQVRLSVFGMRGDKIDRKFKVFVHRKDGLPVFRKLFEFRRLSPAKCAPVARVEYFVGKKKLLDVDVSLSKGCMQGRYVHDKKLHVWKLSPDAVRYLKFLIQHQVPTKSRLPGFSFK